MKKNADRKKVELLAPAGNYDGLLGAISAGADAVYLAGDRFGARAYADNFDHESLLKGIAYAHLFDRRIYLTVNTLIKEKEFAGLYDYLAPLYAAGLDGVIVQDIGVLSWLREQFPQLALHASTQMNITHALGAKFLRELGVTRVVPARELSLEELCAIKATVDIELETFIHGAMCYCYSGQCLFSSILGGRSGNRGRCAQPCRLPYRRAGEPQQNKNHYPLSMRDMCTITILPALITAGISAFKIEGRMKKPEYAAGVTAVYRKYIDQYYRQGSGGYRMAKEDLKQLHALYIRSEPGEGYYYRHNGAVMLTPEHPAYSAVDEKRLQEIKHRYITAPKRIGIHGEGRMIPGEAAVLTVTGRDRTVKVFGSIVQPAAKQPLTAETVSKQLKKSGRPWFVWEDLQLELADNAFYGIKELNELRRQAIMRLEQALLPPARSIPDKRLKTDNQQLSEPPHGQSNKSLSLSNNVAFNQADNRLACVPDNQADNRLARVPDNQADNRLARVPDNQAARRPELHALITDCPQWQAAAQTPVKRIYAGIDLWAQAARPFEKNETQEWFAVLPRIFRQKDEILGDRYREIINRGQCDGLLIANVESFAWLKDIGYSGPVIADESLAIFNCGARDFWQNRVDGYYFSPELNERELKELLKDDRGGSIRVYGRIPLMVTANCADAEPCRQATANCADAEPCRQTTANCADAEPCRQTTANCADAEPRRQATGFITLTDRYGKHFPVLRNCPHCYNIIYNSVPLSWHEGCRRSALNNAGAFRLDFTTETVTEVKQIIGYFLAVPAGEGNGLLPPGPPVRTYTTGHYKRGVE